MNRRRYLAAGVAFAGCAGCVVNSGSPDQSGTEGEDDESGLTRDENQTESDDDGDDIDEQTESTMATYDVIPDEVDDDRPLEHGVCLLHPPLRDDTRPLTLELTLTNRSDERVSYGEQRDALGLDARADGFVLLAPGGTFYGFADGWWTKTAQIARTTEYRVGELDSGDSETVRRVVVVDSIEENPTEIPDRIRFELSYSAGTEGTLTKGTSYEWGFELVADDP